eukprot:gene28704-31869_t
MSPPSPHKRKKRKLPSPPVSAGEDAGQAEQAKAGWRKTLWAAHSTTDAVEEGRGEESVRRADLRGAKACLHSVFSLQPGSKSPWPVSKQSVISGACALAMEQHRAALCARLRKLLAKSCAQLGIQTVPLLAFERWRFSCKWSEDMQSCSTGRKGGEAGSGSGCGAGAGAGAGAGGGPPGVEAGVTGKKQKSKGKKQVLFDTLLPVSSSHCDDQQLCADLERAGVSAEAARQVAASLATASTAGVKELQELAHQLKSGKEAKGVEVELVQHAHSVSLQCGGVVVKLTHEAWEKLQALHSHFSPAAAGKSKEAGQPQAELKLRSEMEQRTFALLLRYKTMQGAGFQAAAGPAVFELLRKRLDVEFEAFASPLNCYFGNYCSAFPDVDGPFGSRGSFFGFSPSKGSFQANPPFVHCIIDGMADHILSLLKSAEAGGRSLSFAVFLPGWEESAGWNLLKASPFNKRMVLVAAKDHGFCDGSSHQSQDPFRRSPYDTGVFFMQSDKATRRWPVTDELEEELRSAMAECMPSAAAEERQNKGRKKNRKVAGGAA